MSTAVNTPVAVRPASNLALSTWCVVAAFGTYFCMYAFRKPFTAGSYAENWFGDANAKTLLVTAQVLGYTVSKFIGIKVIAEMPARLRIVWLLGLILSAEAALVLFALTPSPYRLIFLFANGLPLGMVFGLVLGFLEGRRQTEALTAGLCTSFILADGVTKSVGAYLLEWGVSEWWMPSAAGALFLPPMLAFAWMLSRIPPPNVEDVQARSERTPMTRADRRAFFWRYAMGLTLLVLVYLFVTVLRSIRADFAPEIWRALLGTDAAPERFAQSEIAVGLGVLVFGGFTVFIADSRRAFHIAMMMSLIGLILVTASLLLLRADMLSPLVFMSFHGMGLYLPYVLFHTTVFERLIALTRDRSNIGYLMYLADAFGYLGYVVVMLAKNLLAPPGDFFQFFALASWIVCAACVTALIPCWIYFARHPATRAEQSSSPTSESMQ